MFIDTHCHLNLPDFTDVEKVLSQAKDNDVEKIIIPGIDVVSSTKAIEISHKYSQCYAAIGIHPHHEGQVVVEELLRLGQEKKVVAIGEIGLDYYRADKKNLSQIKKQQEIILKLQLELAREINLPVILHCREAFSDLLTILNSYRVRGVFHCFGGTLENLQEVLKRGFYVGFDGNLTYKNAQNLRDLVAFTPLEKILLETDSPFLTPLPDRGKRNEPKNVKIVADTIAQIKNLDVSEVEKQTTNNAEKLFKLHNLSSQGA